MSELSQAIYNHAICIDKLLDVNSFSGKNLVEWLRPLVQVMTPEGAVPYLLDEKKERYRASPLASTIISMNMANLLPDKANDIMLKELLVLRDSVAQVDNQKPSREKKAEDQVGWSLLEGVSVWSTSLAIIALLTNNEIGKTKVQQYKNSVLWLAEQQKPGEYGWGYQLWDNCNQNVLMTALALRALAAAYRYRDEFAFVEHEKRVLIDSITKGYAFLKDNIILSQECVYWTFDEKPHCAATTWALLALKEMTEIDIKDEIGSFYFQNIDKGIDFIIGEMPSKPIKWRNEQIVKEAGAKYSKQKNYFSFSAVLLLELFELGMTPYHPKVINQIKWLLDNVDEWKIEEYDTGTPCSFTYAMVISTIVRWGVLVGRETADVLVQNISKKRWFFLEKIYCMPVMDKKPIQIIYKPQMYRNITTGVICVLALVLMVGIWNYIIQGIQWIVTLLGRSMEDIIVGAIGSVVATVGIAIITFVGHLFVKHIRRWRK